MTIRPFSQGSPSPDQRPLPPLNEVRPDGKGRGDRLPRHGEVLVVLFGRIGDVVFTLPSVAALARARPDLSIDWIVEDRCADLLSGHPLLRHVIRFERARVTALKKDGHPLRALGEIARLVRTVRSRRYDAVLDFQGLLKSGVATGLARGDLKLGSPSTYGRMREGSALFSRMVALPDPGLHLVERHLLVIKELLDRPVTPVDSGLALSQEEIRSAREKAGTEPFALIHPFASWETRNWPTDHWKETAREMVKRGLRVIVAGAGGGAQDEGARRILEGAGGRGHSLLGQLSLRELAAVMALSEVVLAVDSGPMHIAASSGARVVALFGPTDPIRLGPFGPRKRPGEGESYGRSGRVVSAGLPCQPCMLRRCPIGTPCQSQLSPAVVVEAAQTLMKEQEKAGLAGELSRERKS
ncbi:MAG: glycosyltransferase family 9 protein [Leptospirillia bacterium]